MYNYDVLKNNYRLSIDAKPGEIWLIENAPTTIVDKTRPVLIISDQETSNSGLVTCIMITTHHTKSNSIPVYFNGGISFIVPSNEYSFSYKDLYTYGTRMTIIPERILEFVRYMKFRIYGSPYSDLHEKALYDYQINIIRRLLENSLKLNRLHTDFLDPREYIGGKFSRTFRDWKPENPRRGDVEKVISPSVDLSGDKTSNEEIVVDNVSEAETINDNQLVYNDDSSVATFNNTMSTAIMKALDNQKKQTVSEKKEANARTPRNSQSLNIHQKKNHSASIVKSIEESFDNDSKKEKEEKKLKPYFEISDGKVVIKKLKNMTHGEMGLLLSDVKSTNSYTNFASKCDMTITTIKKRCLDCIKALDEANTPVSDDTKLYFTTDQRVKNNYQSHTIESNMQKKGSGQFAASVATVDSIKKKVNKIIDSHAVCC